MHEFLLLQRAQLGGLINSYLDSVLDSNFVIVFVIRNLYSAAQKKLARGIIWANLNDVKCHPEQRVQKFISSLASKQYSVN